MFNWHHVKYARTWAFAITWKVSKYGGLSGPYFPIFSRTTGKHRPENPLYLVIFHVVHWSIYSSIRTESQRIYDYLFHAKINHWVNTGKSVQIRSFFWSVFSRIRTEYGGYTDQKNSVFGHFSRSERFRENRYSGIFYVVCTCIIYLN